MFAFEKHSTPGAGYTGTVSLKCSFCVQHRIDIFVRLDLRGSAPPATHYHFNHCPQPTGQAYLSDIRLTNISKSFTHKMAAKNQLA